MDAEGPREKWYYDACALDGRITTAYEITSSRSHRSCTSKLAIGEACASELLKCLEIDPKNELRFERFNVLVDLLKNLAETGLEIIGNDDIDEIVEQVKNLAPRLSMTDAIHVATAVKARCCVLCTIDPDYDEELKKPHCKLLASNMSLEKFAVYTMDSRDIFKKEKGIRRLRR
jgi:predicted nucleic acid-binding protein